MKVSLIAMFIIFLASEAFAQTVHWTPVPDSSVQGYRLYRAEGTCSIHGYFSYAAGYPSTATQGAIPAPTVGGDYCHFLVAFNGAGESGPSNYVDYAYIVPEPPQCPSVAYCKTLKGQARKQCLACR